MCRADFLAEFFTGEQPDVAPAQRRWLEEHATLEQTVAGYLAALQGEGVSEPRDVQPALALFPRLALVDARLDGSIHITVKNTGAATIRTRTYGQPEYRLLAKLYEHGTEIQDRWLALPRDLRPGDEATVEFPHLGNPTTLRLYHALQDIPMLEPEAWAEVSDLR